MWMKDLSWRHPKLIIEVEMERIWNFAKRHRGKFLAVGVLGAAVTGN